MSTLSPLEKIVAVFEKIMVAPKAIYTSLSSGMLGKPLRWLGRLGSWYKRRIWDRYTKNDAGTRTGKRVSVTLAATLLFIWLIPTMVISVASVGLIATTLKTEEVYLNQTEEIDPDGDVHSIKGCRSLPCGEAEAIYYRVRPDIAHTFYSLATKGGPFFPDLTASVVAPGVNKCTVTSYGFRMRILRGWGIYPDMLDATCEPFNSPEATPVPSNG